MSVNDDLRLIDEKLAELNRLVATVRQSGGVHNILSATHTDSLAANVIAGDVVIGNATPKWSRLAKGNDGEVLTLAAGLPIWSPAAGGAPTFLDEFADASLYWSWVKQNDNGGTITITEAGGVLTFHINAGTNGDIWSTAVLGPLIHTGILGYPITIEAKLNSYTVNDKSMVGIFVGRYHSTGNYNFMMYGRYRDTGAGRNGLQWVFPPVSGANNGITTLPIWLRMRISAVAGTSRHIIYYDYSIDGINWTNQTSQTHASFTIWDYGLTCGMFAKNWSPFNAVDPDFEYFKQTLNAGPG